ncbi:MAG: hypothetical protein V5A46_10510 [Haloferacaceae archaeon]
MTGDDTRDRVERLHRHLEATLELPVERAASRWIGEAEAITADLAGREADPDVRRERLSHVRELLANVEGTEHPAADDHVAAAEEIVADLLGDVDEDRDGDGDVPP